MNLPSISDYHGMQFQVGSEVYKVRVMRKVDDEQTAGACDDKKKVIYLAAWQGSINGFSTLIHELLHAIEREYDAKIPHHKLHRIEAGIFDFLMQNGIMKIE